MIARHSRPSWISRYSRLPYPYRAAACVSAVALLLTSCSDSSDSLDAAPEPESTASVPESILSFTAQQACGEAVNANLARSGYPGASVTTDFTTVIDSMPNPGTLSGSFRGYVNNDYSQTLAGTVTCTVSQESSSSPVLAEVDGSITESPNDQQRPQQRRSSEGSAGHGSASRGTAGKADSVAQAPQAGARAPKADYEVKPRVDSWEPSMAQYLMNPGMLVPGGAIWNLSSQGRCSAGHFATDSTSNRIFILTAAHCGQIGDRYAYQDPSGQCIEFGSMVERAHSDGISPGEPGHYDIAVIEVTNPHARWTSKPPLTGTLSGSADLRYVAAHGMALCRIGSTGGLSCGNYVSTDDAGSFRFGNKGGPGDSGGAIYAVHPNGDMYAVGITSFGPSDTAIEDTNYAGGMEIFSTLRHFGISVI